MLRELIAKFGIGCKFVRAYCRAMGWRYTAQGAPEQWYAAWRNGLAAAAASALRADPESDRDRVRWQNVSDTDREWCVAILRHAAEHRMTVLSAAHELDPDGKLIGMNVVIMAVDAVHAVRPPMTPTSMDPYYRTQAAAMIAERYWP